MFWINDYPEHACVLAKFSADSMLLNPTEVWLDAPPQPQHNTNKVANCRLEQSRKTSPEWIQPILAQQSQADIPEATWTCKNSANVLGTARVKCKNKQRKRLQLLHPDTPIIAANIGQWQTLHDTNVNQYKSPHIPKVKNWNLITYTDGSAMQDAFSKQQIIGAGIFTPTTTLAVMIPSLSILEAAAPHSPSIELNLQLC